MSYCKISSFGNKRWYAQPYSTKYHRIDGPALELTNGTKQWWQNGKLHRTDGPAIECDGIKHWYQNDKCHRLDGPAVEWADGTKEWWVDGKHISCKTQEEFERLIKLKAFW